jgi:hypothetical protein
MDARIDPAQAFGIDLGDAHVIRNAGASALDALRSIVISEQLLGVSPPHLLPRTPQTITQSSIFILTLLSPLTRPSRHKKSS